MHHKLIDEGSIVLWSTAYMYSVHCNTALFRNSPRSDPPLNLHAQDNYCNFSQGCKNIFLEYPPLSAERRHVSGGVFNSHAVLVAVQHPFYKKFFLRSSEDIQGSENQTFQRIFLLSFNHKWKMLGTFQNELFANCLQLFFGGQGKRTCLQSLTPR